MKNVGDRVGAVMSATETEVKLFGYGIYLGREVPEPGVQIFGIEMSSAGLTNPAVQLDSGAKVYGCECWWGSEEKVREMIGNRTVIDVDIREERKKSQSPSETQTNES